MHPDTSGRLIERWIFDPNGDFTEFQLWPNVADILQKGIRNVIYCWKWLLWTPKTLLHTLDDLLWCVEQLLKNHEKCHFFFYFPSKGIQKKKWHFSWFFQSCSTHHRRSSKVCRIVLGVQRSHFKQQITFLMPSGKISATFGHNWNSWKSPFWSKIHLSIHRPEVSGCMIYGRKWKPEVF